MLVPCPLCSTVNAPRTDMIVPTHYDCACGHGYSVAKSKPVDSVDAILNDLVRTRRIGNDGYTVGTVEGVLRRPHDAGRAGHWVLDRLTASETASLGLRFLGA